MSEFINTADVIGDDEMCDQIIMRTVTEYKEERVTKVGGYAFYGCKALEVVDLPNVTNVASYAFNGCKALEVVDLPNVTNVASYAFNGCNNIKTINLPEVTKLGTEAFSNAISGSVVLPKWTSSGSYPFYRSSLVRITAPILTSLGDSTFRFAWALKYAEFGSLTSIEGNYNFQEAPIKTLIIRTSTMCTMQDASTFKSSSIASGTGYIYVPRALVDSYKAATNWSTYSTQFRALEDYTVDGTATGELDETKI
jgi:hypothetical protein